MRLIVKDGTIVTPAGCYMADIVVDDGIITSIHADASISEADVVYDASERLVFPGFIDPHVHSRDPGLTHKEDFSHATRAAAVGGVTTILDMPNTLPPVSDASSLAAQIDHHTALANVDFGLWTMAIGTENVADLSGAIDSGSVGVKLFWGYSLTRAELRPVWNIGDDLGVELIRPPSTGQVFEIFRAVEAADSLLAIHCEDLEVVESATRALGREVADYEDFLLSRPDTAEAATIAIAIEMSEGTGCRLHIVHVSSARGVGLIRAAQARGVRVTAETCPHYLVLTDADYQTAGPVMKVFPPIYRAADRTALLEAVRDGAIGSIGSDHAPHTIEEKGLTLARTGPGFVGVETIVRIMLDQVNRGNLTRERLAAVLSQRTAQIFNIFPQKGVIRPGSDGDFTIVDLTQAWEIRNEDLHSKNRITPWHGFRGQGLPVASIVRGAVVMQDGEMVLGGAGEMVHAGGRMSHPAGYQPSTIRSEERTSVSS